MWACNLMVNNIVRSKYIFVENNKIEILFSNYIFGLTFQSFEDGLWKESLNIQLENNISILLFSTKMYLLLTILFTKLLIILAKSLKNSWKEFIIISKTSDYQILKLNRKINSFAGIFQIKQFYFYLCFDKTKLWFF